MIPCRMFLYGDREGGPKILRKPPTREPGAKTFKYSHRVRSHLPRLQIAFGNDAFMPFRHVLYAQDTSNSIGNNRTLFHAFFLAVIEVLFPDYRVGVFYHDGGKWYA